MSKTGHQVHQNTAYIPQEFNKACGNIIHNVECILWFAHVWLLSVVVMPLPYGAIALS